MELVAQFIRALLGLFIACMVVRFVVDWVQVFARSWSPKGPLLLVLEVVYSVTDPPIRFLRRFVPPLRLGSVALDLSFLIVFFTAYLLFGLVGSLAR